MDKWRLKGKFYESCRQSGHCALWFGRDLTAGHCSNFATFQIKEGHINNIEMKGIIIIQCGDGIGPTQADLDPSKGGGIKEGAVYVSDNAGPEQRKVLTPFVKNNLGAELWKKCLGVKYVKISIKNNRGMYHITYPFGEKKLSKATGEGNKPVVLKNPRAYNQAVPLKNYVCCNTWSWKYNDYGKSYEFNNTSGTIADFDIIAD